jgi:flagellar basal-body rod protein FlgB
MFLADVTNNGTIPALEKMLSFIEQRQHMLVENIANVDTPDYKSKQLDVSQFQKSLRKAIDQREQSGGSILKIEDTRQFRQDRSGRLQVMPETDPAENILFHDKSNMRIERQMSMLAENSMMHQMTTQLLLGRFKSLNSAIRGQVS